MTRRKLVAGNWKMFGTAADLDQARAIAAGVGEGADVALCLPATLIERAARALPGFAIGAQDIHAEPNGAHTGCISAGMLLDAGARITIVGHSERRAAQHETDADVRAKATIAIVTGLWTIICVGESLAVRESGEAIATVCNQLDASLPPYDDLINSSLSIAYEPIWAIGTGKIPSTDDIAAMHSALRQRLVVAYGDDGNNVRILYGGSVKASNAAEIFAIRDVDGALVGGASLKAADFLPIVHAAKSARGAPGAG